MSEGIKYDRQTALIGLKSAARMLTNATIITLAGAHAFGRELTVMHHELNAPIDMLLFCPLCRAQHIDAPAGEWANPPHRTHLCAHCGGLWRPSHTATNGVAAL